MASSSQETRCNFEFMQKSAPMNVAAQMTSTSDLWTGHTATLVGSKVFVIGKLGRRLGYSSSILSWDHIRNDWRWTHLGHFHNTPYPQYHSAVLFEDSLYVFGGRDESVLLANRDLWKLDLAVMEWNACNTRGLKPRHLAGHTCDFFEESMELVFFGGRLLHQDQGLSSVFVNNLEKQQWIYPIVKAGPPIGRYLHMSCRVREDIYIWGGIRDTTTPLNDMSILHRNRDCSFQWSHPRVNNPSPAYSATLSNFKEKLIMYGGNVAGGATRSCFAFDPKANRWEPVEYYETMAARRGYNQIRDIASNRMRALSHHCTVVANDRLIIIGGHGRKSWRTVYVLREL